MNEWVQQRFLSPEQALNDPVTYGSLAVIVALFATTWAGIVVLRKMGRIEARSYAEVMVRWRSWLIISGVLLTPILLGPGWVIIGVCVLSLMCYREFARVTGLFREKTISLTVVLGILLLTFAAFDNYSRLFFASAALTVGLIAISTIPQDRPKGYVQRTALGVLGFLLFGYSFSYLGYFANSPQYRSILILLILCTEMNDVFAFCVGKLVGGPKVIPQTSPGKTWSGCIGALILTTVFTATLSHFQFQGTPLDRFDRLLIFGVGLSVLGQFGDLLLSSIKRDIGIKDIGNLIPAHGGLLDRFDSLVLIPPAAFHFLSLYLGAIGANQPERIFTGI